MTDSNKSKIIAAGLISMVVDPSIEEMMGVKVKQLFTHNGTDPVFVLARLLKQIELDTRRHVRVLYSTVTLKSGGVVPQFADQPGGMSLAELLGALSGFVHLDRIESITGVVSTGIGWQDHFQVTDALAYSYKGVPGQDHRIIIPGATSLVGYLRLLEERPGYNRVGLKRRHLETAKPFTGRRIITAPKEPEVSLSDRIMTLPSGRKVVLKGIDHDTLAELHEIKTEGIKAMRHTVLTGMEAYGKNGTEMLCEPGIAAAQRSTSRMLRDDEIGPLLQMETRETFSGYLAGQDPSALHDNTRTLMEEAVADPIHCAAEKLDARKAWNSVSRTREEMFMGTEFGKALMELNSHDFDLATPTAEQRANEDYVGPEERARRAMLSVRRSLIRTELYKRGMDDRQITQLFDELKKRGVNLLNFNMDALVITYSPAAPTVFDGALESFNKKAKKQGKKIKQ